MRHTFNCQKVPSPISRMLYDIRNGPKCQIFHITGSALDDYMSEVLFCLHIGANGDNSNLYNVYHAPNNDFALVMPNAYSLAKIYRSVEHMNMHTYIVITGMYNVTPESICMLIKSIDKNVRNMCLEEIIDHFSIIVVDHHDSTHSHALAFDPTDDPKTRRLLRNTVVTVDTDQASCVTLHSLFQSSAYLSGLMPDSYDIVANTLATHIVYTPLNMEVRDEECICKCMHYDDHCLSDYFSIFYRIHVASKWNPANRRIADTFALHVVQYMIDVVNQMEKQSKALLSMSIVPTVMEHCVNCAKHVFRSYPYREIMYATERKLSDDDTRNDGGCSHN